MLHPTRILATFALLLTLIVGTVAPSSAAQAEFCSVTSPADSGKDTLRAHLASPLCLRITFNLPQAANPEIAISTPLVINRYVVIRGPGTTALAIRYAGAPAADGRVFDIAGGTVTISDLTISGGRTDGGRGAGLRIVGSTTPADVTLRNVLVTDNVALAAPGGGIAVQDATLTLDKSTVSGNKARGNGGGIFSEDGTLTLTESTVSGDNYSGFRGGGLAVEGGAATIIDSVISYNDAVSDGGGVYASSAMATLLRSIVSDNDAVHSGGGIYSRDSTLTLTNSTLNRNNAGDDGGGIANDDGTLTLTNSTVSDRNSAGRDGGGLHSIANSSAVTLTNSTVSGNEAGGNGGGVLSQFGTLTLTNSTISGNIAWGDGGGIAIDGGTATLLAVTLVGNTAAGSGGGLFTDGIALVPTTMTFGRTIVAGNVGGATPAADDCATADPTAAPLTSTGNNLLGTGCPVGATDLALTAPLDSVLSLKLGDNGGPTKTHALVVNSPALDRISGLPCTKLPTDQRGIARPKGAACDIGAYEFVPKP